LHKLNETTAAMKLFNILVLGLIYGASAKIFASDWYLARKGLPTASVGGTTTSKILMTYESGKGDFEVSVFATDCVTSATAVTATQTSTYIKDFKIFELAVALNIDQTKISTSNVWTTDGSTKGTIALCVRVDLLDKPKGTSYNFNEQKLMVTVDLTQGFTIAAVAVDRTATGEDTIAAQTDYGLTVCQCNENSECSTSTIVQGVAAFICIKTTPGSGVLISSIQKLQYSQAGVIKIPAITNGEPNGFSDVINSNTTARIQSILPSIVFAPANVKVPLVGEGVAVVRFGSGRARSLRFSVGNSAGQIGGRASRLMQEQQTGEAQTGFSVTMALASNTNESQELANTEISTGALIGAIVGAISGVAIIVALLLAVCRRKKEDDKHEQANAGCAETTASDQLSASSRQQDGLSWVNPV
jgi:hypothetical protein